MSRCCGTLKLSSRAWIVIWALLAACSSAPPDYAVDGDRAPRTVAGHPEEFPTPFSVIKAVMALPDGRLILSDPQENRINLIDFSKGTVQPLGRIGEGPREYRRAAGLSRGPGGGVQVFDHELRRLVPISAAGEVQEVIPLGVGGLAGGVSLRGPDDLSFDSLGNTYQRRGLGSYTAGEYLVLRHRSPVRADTVARLLGPIIKAVNARRNGTGVYQEMLFSPRDAWTVAPDGRVGVVRSKPYRVEWIQSGGEKVTGPMIVYKPIKIIKAEKELIASGRSGDRGQVTVSLVMVAPGGPRVSSRAVAPEPMPVKDLLFAKVKPPINLRMSRWPRIDEMGRLWVERSQRLEASAALFDVFDRSGNLVDRIELPAGSRLVGFDKRWLYAARIDADDFEHLQRFRLPVAGSTPR